jgi:hypothetical protein
VAPREVLKEVNRGNDSLLEWVKTYEDIFLEPCDGEIEAFQRIWVRYPQSELDKHSIGPWADPLVIACAEFYKLPIIQHEATDKNQFKIPSVASHFNLKCIRLIDFFQDQGWTF